MSLLIISGISGSGKSTAINALEDIDYFCIDNLPPALLLPVARLQSTSQSTTHMAVVIDCRAKEMYQTLSNELKNLKDNNIDFKLIFIDAEKEKIVNRYKQTRRKHPLLSDEFPTLTNAIDKEYQLCKKIKNKADIVIDTTYLTVTQLKNNIIEAFNTSNYKSLNIKIMSFGYRNGLPAEADLIYDVRCLPNPYYLPELRNHSGLDDCVYDYVFSFEQSKVFAQKILDFVTYALPYYLAEGKTELVIAFGCTSGHHRSVSFARYLAANLKSDDYKIITLHRDIEKPF